MERTNRISLGLGSIVAGLLGIGIIYNVRLHPQMNTALSWFGQGIGILLIAAAIVAAIIVVES